MNIEFHEYTIVLGWRKKRKAARNMFIEAARGEVEEQITRPNWSHRSGKAK